MKQNPSAKHHYIPIFYTKRWTDSDGRVTVFSRPYRNVIDRKVFPKGIGYEFELYKINAEGIAHPQQVEERYFKPVDSLAADVLQKFELVGNGISWNARNRSAWTRFLLSLLLRAPEDVEVLRGIWQTEYLTFSEGEEEEYRRSKGVNDPPTFFEWVKLRPASELEVSFHRAYLKLLDNEKIGEFINGMVWRVIRVPENAYPLLTSDRPLIRTNGLDTNQGHIVLPIGPKLIFIAAANRNIANVIEKIKINRLVKEINRQVSASAVRFVVSDSIHQFEFIKKHFAKRPQARLVETIASNRKIAKI